MEIIESVTVKQEHCMALTEKHVERTAAEKFALSCSVCD